MFYVDNLYFYRTPDWFIFEPLSKMLLLFLHDLTDDTVKTVIGAHYMISAVYLLGTLAVFPPSRGNWRGLIMAFALYGSQLAFVTIRATPAYFIASIAAMRALRGQNRAFLFAVLASLFHISAVLTIPPIIAQFAKARFRWLAILQRPRSLLVSLGLLAVLFVLFGSGIFAAVQTVFKAIPFLGKYLVFAVGLSDSGTADTGLTGYAIGHFILLFSITIFTGAFLFLNERETRSAGIFIVVSYALYLFTFLAFSPIAAFRQTPFWMLPAFSVFPWDRVGWRNGGHVAFFGLAAGMFAFQFSRVIIL